MKDHNRFPSSGYRALLQFVLEDGMIYDDWCYSSDHYCLSDCNIVSQLCWNFLKKHFYIITLTSNERISPLPCPYNRSTDPNHCPRIPWPYENCKNKKYCRWQPNMSWGCFSSIIISLQFGLQLMCMFREYLYARRVGSNEPVTCECPTQCLRCIMAILWCVIPQGSVFRQPLEKPSRCS